MQLSEFLLVCPVLNATHTRTPIELSYYDDYSWKHIAPFRSEMFASLDFAHLNSAEFLDGELVAISATDYGVTLHVVA